MTSQQASPRKLLFRSLGLIVVLVLGSVVSSASASAATESKPFGIASFSLELTERTEEETSDGEHYEFVNVPYRTPLTQAGGHPWGLTVKGEFTSEEIPSEGEGVNIIPTRDPKDFVTSLPPGLLGDPMAVPRCSLTYVTSSSELCPADTQIGVYLIHEEGTGELFAPIVNVTPEAGQSAEFALENTTKIDTPLLTAHLVHGPEGYSFTVVSNNIPALAIQRLEATFWGVPADHSHDAMRNRICKRSVETGPLTCEGGNQASGIAPVPFLTMPTDCAAGPQSTVLRADSWEEPGSVSNGEYHGYAKAESCSQP